MDQAAVLALFLKDFLLNLPDGTHASDPVICTPECLVRSLSNQFLQASKTTCPSTHRV